MSDQQPPPTSAPRKMSAAAAQRRHERNIRRDIEHAQQSGRAVIPYTSFSRVVHEVLADQGDFCIRTDAVRALQAAAEDRLTDMFVSANNLAMYNGRETVSGRDLRFTLPSKPCIVEEQPEPPLPVLDL